MTKLEKLGFTNISDKLEEIKYKNKRLDEYEYFGRDKRPDYCITLSKIKTSEAKPQNYTFLGLCCDSYGNKGFLFNDNRKNITRKIKLF